MIDVPKNSQAPAIAKMQEILDRAIDAGADSVTIEFAKEGGLEVLFVFGNTGVGDILVEQSLEAEVMTLICDQAGLEEKSCGVLHWECHGQNLDILVEEYENFGENAYKLTFPK
ncbi:hypothetical protein D1AOALGA4SA_11895 [Olavius algarvensis Delta 1 endosymbiont]|nr:hypothetical protein D1AOALGA4SA_11895 [Olavius algarvensis Delta 1 endosymbiont]